MLKALARWILRAEPVQTLNGHTTNYVSREELQKALHDFEQRTEWELGEWYDKFSTLHARAEKRVNREARKQGRAPGAPNGHAEPVESERPSVLALRKPWSV